MNKRGVSAIVATVLIIVITVAAVAIIWTMVLPMMRDSLSIGDSCKDADLTIKDDGYTCYIENNFTNVQIKKGNSNAEIVGANIIISSEGNSYSYPVDFQFVKGQEKVFSVDSSNFSVIEKIGVSAIVKNGNKNKSCSAVYLENVKKCASEEVTDGDLINDEPAPEDPCGTSGNASDPDCWSLEVSKKWGPQTGNYVTGANSLVDGKSNTNILSSVGVNYFEAAYYCYNLTEGGLPTGTWYLPAKDQLWDGYLALGKVFFPNYGYWSSTEYIEGLSQGNPQYMAWFLDPIGFEAMSYYSQELTHFVRCLR